MVVDYLSMSSVDFAISDLCSLIPNVPALAGNFLAGLHWRQNVSGMSGNHRSDFLEPVRGLSPDCRLQGSCPVVGSSSRCHGANVTMRTLTKPAVQRRADRLSAVYSRVPAKTLGRSRRNRFRIPARVIARLAVAAFASGPTRRTA